MLRSSSAAIFIALALASCGKSAVPADTAVPASEPKAQKTILALGDSLTAGYELPPESSYPAQLEGILKSKGYSVRVTNAGVSGETSAGLLSRVDWVLSDENRPDLVILCVGANDGLQSLSVEEMEKNIRSIVSKTKASGIRTVLVGMRMPVNLGPDYVASFSAVYKRIAKDESLEFYPFLLEDVARNPELNLRDGIHPNAAGYAIVAENVADFLIENELVVK